MLGRVIGEHWLPLVRDVLALGFRATDILTTLSVGEMVAIVCAAPPGSSLRDAMDGGWSREAQLLANLQEQQAGIAELPKAYERPGIEQRPKGAAVGDNEMFGGQAEEMTWEQAEARDKERYQAAVEAQKRGVKPRNTKVRTL